MPINREITVTLADQPGTLANVCRALANRGVNILAIQAMPEAGRTRVNVVVDNPSAAATVFNSQNLAFTETQIVQVALPNRPGELARATTKLGEARININRVYSGIESGTNESLMFFAVSETGRAASILDAAVGAAGA